MRGIYSPYHISIVWSSFSKLWEERGAKKLPRIFTPPIVKKHISLTKISDSIFSTQIIAQECLKTEKPLNCLISNAASNWSLGNERSKSFVKSHYKGFFFLWRKECTFGVGLGMCFISSSSVDSVSSNKFLVWWSWHWRLFGWSALLIRGFLTGTAPWLASNF